MRTTAHKRAELDLQISLLTEYEVTKLIAVVAAVAERLADLKQDVIVDSVLDKIESAGVGPQASPGPSGKSTEPAF